MIVQNGNTQLSQPHNPNSESRTTKCHILLLRNSKLFTLSGAMRCDVTTFYWNAFASSRPMGILAHMKK